MVYIVKSAVGYFDILPSTNQLNVNEHFHTTYSDRNVKGYLDRCHYSDVIMSLLVSQITLDSTLCLFRLISKKHQSPRYWPFVKGIHRWPVDSPHKEPVTRSRRNPRLGYARTSFGIDAVAEFTIWKCNLWKSWTLKLTSEFSHAHLTIFSKVWDTCWFHQDHASRRNAKLQKMY